MNETSPRQRETRSGRGRVTLPSGAGSRFRLFVLASLVLGALSIAASPIHSIGTMDAEAASSKYRKVVALTPFAANSMALMGVFPEAIGQTLGGDRRYVSGLRSTPRLTMSHPNGPNMEELVVYGPDLIFSSPEWSAGRSAMEQIAGRVVDADPNSIAGSFAKVREIARLIGRESRGKRLIGQMKRSVRSSPRGISSRPRVMLILGVGKTPHVFLEDSWGGEIVRRAGGRLQTGGASGGGGFARISNEVVIDENPQVIIAVPHANADEITTELKDELRAQWAGTAAAADGRIYFSDDNSLLQAGTDIGQTIRKVRRFLGNFGSG